MEKVYKDADDKYLSYVKLYGKLNPESDVVADGLYVDKECTRLLSYSEALDILDLPIQLCLITSEGIACGAVVTSATSDSDIVMAVVLPSPGGLPFTYLTIPNPDYVEPDPGPSEEKPASEVKPA